MFRRQTDQVYEMLQQVQRQMSNTAEGGSSWSSQASQGSSGLGQPRAEQPWPTPSNLRPTATGDRQVPPPTTPTESSGGHPPLGGFQAVPSGQVTPPSAGQGMREQTAGYSRQPMARGISLPLASVLALLWLLTIAVAYMIGHHQGTASQAIGGVGFASGEAGEREVVDGGGSSATGGPIDTSVGQTTGVGGPSDILVLKSVRGFDDATLRRWEAEAEKLNDISREDPRLPAYFAVRKPTSGGLQLVFGFVDGRFGVDQGDYEAQTGLLKQAAYGGAEWRDIR